jgi:hypothetical protein
MKATKDTQDPSGDRHNLSPTGDSPLFTDSQAANLLRLLQEPVMSRVNRARRRLQQELTQVRDREIEEEPCGS